MRIEKGEEWKMENGNSVMETAKVAVMTMKTAKVAIVTMKAHWACKHLRGHTAESTLTRDEFTEDRREMMPLLGFYEVFFIKRCLH